MTTERKFSKLLAVASNYDIPQPGIDSIKTAMTYSAPTLYDGLEFAEFGPPEGTDPEYSSFLVYGLTLSVQVASDQDLSIEIYQSNTNSLISELSFTLPANELFVKLSLGTTPKEGLSHSNSYYAKVVQDGTTPTVLAEGADLSYILSRV